MLQWYSIKAPGSTAAKKVTRSLRRQRLMVRPMDSDGHAVAAAIGEQHHTWLRKVARDFNASITKMDGPPAGLRGAAKDEYTAACGEVFFDPILVSQHTRRCEQCKAAKAAAPGP